MGEVNAVNVIVNAFIFLVTGSAAWNVNEIMAYLNPNRLEGSFFDIRDSSLAYPRRNTLPLAMMVKVIIGSSLAVLALGELSSVLRGKYSLKTALYNFIRVYGLFVYGWFIHTLWVMTTKGVLVTPRPHFIESCKPDMSKVTGSDSLVPLSVCTANEKTMKDATGSFPSGHAAIACYACFFWLFYAQTKLPSNTPKMVTAFLQGVTLMVSFLSSVTRIVDNRHSWSDVIVGVIFGVLLAVWMANLSGTLPKFVKPTKEQPPAARLKTD
ncbi:phospholipid phosphatase 1-like [Ptychodera flava]|uniref:phospholipid phosphatase 1-like n=1 Tax=Ptychodera flava TaxID=63121 RepID=UPI00396A6D90